MPTTAAYGSWASPITAGLIAGESIGLYAVAFDGDAVYWAEGRPSEGGRVVLVRHADGVTEDVTPPPFNARSRVHEYGGGAFIVTDGVVTFVNFADQRLYRHRHGETPTPLTPEGPWRYADMALDRTRGRVIAVREDHNGQGQPPRNLLVSVDPVGDGPGVPIAEGRDF